MENITRKYKYAITPYLLAVFLGFLAMVPAIIVGSIWNLSYCYGKNVHIISRFFLSFMVPWVISVGLLYGNKKSGRELIALLGLCYPIIGLIAIEFIECMYVKWDCELSSNPTYYEGTSFFSFFFSDPISYGNFSKYWYRCIGSWEFLLVYLVASVLGLVFTLDQLSVKKSPKMPKPLSPQSEKVPSKPMKQEKKSEKTKSVPVSQSDKKTKATPAKEVSKKPQAKKVTTKSVVTTKPKKKTVTSSSKATEKKG